MARQKFDASLKEASYCSFAYRILRLWQIPAEQLLSGGIGILPVAPLADDAANALPAVIARIDRRLKSEATPDEADKLRATTTILLGLRHPPDLIRQIMQGASAMWDKVFEDSSMVREAVKRGEYVGEITHARKMVLRQGRMKFGPPDAATVSSIETIDNLERLDLLGERLLTVNSWSELLAN